MFRQQIDTAQGHGLSVIAKGFNLPLQINQTIAVEPKFVFPGSGAIGIETTYVVGNEGGDRRTCLGDESIKL